MSSNSASRSPWFWVPTVYLAEGLPNALVAFVAVQVYNSLGVSNDLNTFLTSSLYLPWVLKPLWSPVVDLIRTRRWWIWTMQLVLGAGAGAVALMIPAPHFIQWTILFFGLLAFSSATHDIAADGFYMLAATEGQQSFFIGMRSVFFNLGKITAQGGLVVIAGQLEKRTGQPAFAWSVTFALAAVIFLGLGIYHRSILPRPPADKSGSAGVPENFLAEFLKTFGTFFQKPGIVLTLLFLLVYRLGEAQLAKMIPLFLAASREKGGLGLATDEIGVVYGTAGMIAFMIGALLGGWAVSRRGLKFWLWPMLLAIHLPDGVFVWLSYAQPQNLYAIGAGVAVEQFGYGFGYTAYLMYMIHIARGLHSTAHYAICTGFMALGAMVPGMWSGALQHWIGYRYFFVWVLVTTIPGFIVTMIMPLDREFGKKREK